MNERIKQLEDQCWVKVPCDFDMRKGGLSTINTVFDRKKFAELIVRKCLEVIQDKSMGSGDDCETGLQMAKGAIVEHFGVM